MANIDFKAQGGRRDVDKHYYNALLVTLMD